MELLEAVKRMNMLREDSQKLDNWVAHLTFNDKPVTGHTWLKVKSAIAEVVEDLMEEHNELKEKIESATTGMEIDHQPYKLSKREKEAEPKNSEAGTK